MHLKLCMTSFIFQTLLHSILALVLYQDTGSYSPSLLTKWWIWGCVATVAAVILVLGSTYILRQGAYELFLISHIVMAVICVVGCWYHVYIGYENTFGYETWLYATIGVWFFDRLVRLARVLKGGFRHSIVTEISPTIVRLDIPSIRWAAPGHCVYVYFPTLNPLKPWENHPFSMVQTAALARQKHNVSQSATDFRDSKDDTVQTRSAAVAHGSPYTTAGVTLFVRKTEGMTKSIKPHHGLLTLVEGPYPTNHIKSVLQSDRLLLVGGGIGITGLLPFVTRYPNVKLLYSIKAADQPFLDVLGPLLDVGQEKEIVVGRRLNLDALLQDEAETGWSKIAVLVCGPTGMCNDIRTIVSRLSREKANACTFELEVDALAW
ncbi:hypothetical protein PFICI_04944 [Pestalotiopsis fici W106-1]|uniref:Ferric oxidoreductase domain-containing protein n=1 Tax=Pestalotiopsis fici (strain W106-1 / CGMCC3.15140) TaxID=1229662 RepID=W3XAE0_PESFW|nr:uncharacterized protein PFICI_04944 [Pestalotiopsis fici W106-1]ETS83068.1 hypothetical protein PFICI_04944 [Pestalotiopsis fici W106-1]